MDFDLRKNATLQLRHDEYALLKKLVRPGRWNSPEYSGGERQEVEFYDLTDDQLQTLREFDPSEITYTVEEDAFAEPEREYGAGERRDGTVIKHTSFEQAFQHVAAFFSEDRSYVLEAHLGETTVEVRRWDFQSVGMA